MLHNPSNFNSTIENWDQIKTQKIRKWKKLIRVSCYNFTISKIKNRLEKNTTIILIVRGKASNISASKIIAI